MILLYQIALLLVSPALLLWMGWRVAMGRMPGLKQRWGWLGKLPAIGSGPRLWLHAVSLGEVKVAATLASELREELPGLRVIFTTSTKTGQQEARRLAAPEDTVLYPPLDFAWVCRRFLHRLRPDALIIVETEFWPNLFWQARRAGVPLLIVNGRISDRSWPQYACTRWFWTTTMQAVSAVFPSTQTDAGRFLALGLPAEKLRPVSNLKFRIRAQQPSATNFVTAAEKSLANSRPSPVIVAGSTMEGEETLLLDAFSALRKQSPALWLILAPRHPERFATVASLIGQRGLPFQRRSNWQPGQPILTSGVLLLDSIGELSAVYGLATVAFVGGTLVPRGGHNILEPAALGKPVVVGTSMENFREIAARFLSDSENLPLPPPVAARAAAAIQIDSAESLAPALQYLLDNPAHAAQIGNRARKIVDSYQSGYTALRDEIVSILRKGKVRG